MVRSQINRILKKAELFEKLAESLMAEPQIFYRAQPKGKSLFHHTSGLAYEKVPGIFAFENPEKIFDTYSWVHMSKNPDDYEMITFKGKLVDRPADSEGVVVKPEQIIEQVPLTDFAKKYIK